MHEQIKCSRCQGQFALRNAYTKGGRRSFFVPGAAKHYAPDLPVKLEHLLLDIEVSPEHKSLKGSVTQKLLIQTSDLKWIRLDQIDLKISKVLIDQKEVSFHVQGQKLEISAESRAPKKGESITLKVEYELSNPKRGLFFSGPDKDYPNKKWQAWSQGQDEDTRYWIPTLDYPNQKSVTEVIARVPKGMKAISNGALLSQSEVGNSTQFHYRLGTPQVTYLITLVVGDFTEMTDSTLKGVPVQFFVPPGREADGKRSFGNTAKMIQAFSKKIGVNYPYEKYAQSAVQDFIFGGMENTSATTQTDRTLHDERAHLDFSSDPLVAHELAHQWFGDLLTCRDWSHGWLNEGFATFMERVWVEESEGWSEAQYYQYADLKEYLEEDGQNYRRSIVCNSYIEPIDLFDRHLYQKGGLVLNLIRGVLGPEDFWKSIQTYVSRHKTQNVETLDLIRAIEDTTGRNLRRLFDEWVFGAGHPEFEASLEWHEEKKLIEINLEQKQTQGAVEKTEAGATTHLFHLPIEIYWVAQDGSEHTQLLELKEGKERVFIPCSAKPKMVRLDPKNFIPKTLKFSRPKDMLIYQLKNDKEVMGRIEAAQELAESKESEALIALEEQLISDNFWGVQAEIANILSRLRSESAKTALIKGLNIQHPKARRAVVTALASYKDKSVARALEPLAQGDSSYFVESDAIYSWSKTQPDLKLEQLKPFLKKDSYLDVIRYKTLKGIENLRGIERGDQPEAIALLFEWSKRGYSDDARAGAVFTLGNVLRVAAPHIRHEIIEHLNSLADENDFRLRMYLVQSLGQSECFDAIPILNKIRSLDTDGRIKRNSMLAIEEISRSGASGESIVNLKRQIEELDLSHRKLRSWMEERENR